MKKIILSVAVLALLFSGCKKKTDDPAPAKTTTENLTAHSWKISGAVSNVPIDADADKNVTTPNTTDLWNGGFYDACSKDNIFTFSANGTGTYADAGVPCGGAASTSFTWVLSGNALTITIGTAPNTFVQMATIASIDDNTFKLALAQDTDDNNVSYIETDTFTK